MKSNNMMSSVVKGLAAGAVVGTATYMMTSKKNNKFKKNASKAARAIGTVVENISYMMK